MPEQRFQADRATYIKAHAMLAVLGGIAATVVLYAIGNPHGWVGIIAGILGVGVRGWYMMSEELGHVWTLTAQDLSGPMGRRVTLGNIARVRTLGSAVQVVTAGGDKHMIKFLADPAEVKDRIEAAAERGSAR